MFSWIAASLCYDCRLWFTKETEETTLVEINRIKGEFTTLTPYVHSDDVTFDFLPILSMLDNLIKNRLLGNRNQSLCPFCLGTMKQCMDPNFSPDPSPESLQLMCMSVLHYMLHCIDHIFKGKHTMKSNQCLVHLLSQNLFWVSLKFLVYSNF